MTTKAILTTKNENYPGPGEFSTKDTEISLDNDPNYNPMAIVTFAIDGDELNFELRSQKEEVSVSGANGQTTTTYKFSAFGVKQPDGSVYGNN